mmetsp:Transcript_17951/g.37566  ORF Transcript_17951/g.37566 Transcript_17951/m.37566 type:complete len:281 (-) Transcript_17951:436-1278(-)
MPVRRTGGSLRDASALELACCPTLRLGTARQYGAATAIRLQRAPGVDRARPLHRSARWTTMRWTRTTFRRCGCFTWQRRPSQPRACMPTSNQTSAMTRTPKRYQRTPTWKQAEGAPWSPRASGGDLHRAHALAAEPLPRVESGLELDQQPPPPFPRQPPARNPRERAYHPHLPPRSAAAAPTAAARSAATTCAADRTTRVTTSSRCMPPASQPSSSQSWSRVCRTRRTAGRRDGTTVPAHTYAPDARRCSRAARRCSDATSSCKTTCTAPCGSKRAWTLG